MQECSIGYIPQRLQQNGKPIIEKFEVGECLYMRCKPEALKNPYESISITELSHNRAGLQHNILCNPDDVLYSIKSDEPFEKYEGLDVCTLAIKSLNANNQYHKEYSEEKNGQTYTGMIKLLHEPVPCMYPHSVFRVWLNGETVTYDNYKQTLKKVTKIRNLLKEELASMIRRNQVSQDDNPI